MYRGMSPTLPDEVIEYIFSFLSPRDLVGTALVSERWRDFWVSTYLSYPPSFDIIPLNYETSIDFFQQFLQRRRDSAGASPTVLRRLSVEWPSFNAGEVLCNLITTALDHHVRELYISLPQAETRRFAFLIPNLAIPTLVFSAPKLRTLVLHNVWLTPGQNIMTCPDLETLGLKNSVRLSANVVLKLCTAKLKKLEVENYSRELELHTPKLSSLSHKENNTCLECWFGKLDPLSNADGWLDRHSLISRSLKDSLLRQLPLEEASHARVSVEGESLVLQTILSPLVRLLKSYHNLRSLELSTTLGNTANFTPLASSLIHSISHFIELFVLKVVHNENISDTNIQMAPWPFSCTLDNLKCIAVQGLIISDHEVEFLRLLFSRAVNLERIIIIEEVKEYQLKENLWMEFTYKLAQGYPSPKISFQLL